MKTKISINSAIFVTILCFSQSVNAKGFNMNDFAKGFLEGNQGNECEKTYSPAMCAQMEDDLAGTRSKLNQLESQQNRNSRNR